VKCDTSNPSTSVLKRESHISAKNSIKSNPFGKDMLKTLKEYFCCEVEIKDRGAETAGNKKK
jgi:hypothetical protein